MISKSEILTEIRRLALTSAGTAPGMRTFERETGIRPTEWLGVHWRAWGDAVKEAGLTPNTLTNRVGDVELLHRYCALTRELGRFPTKSDFRLKRRGDSTFPSADSFLRRFGSYPAARSKAYEFALSRSEFADVSSLLATERAARNQSSAVSTRIRSTGFVYLVKHGSRSEYKIGKTMNRLRREGEIRLQLPEKLTPVHYIETDDPAGVKAYWHTRFASKRKEGEWFELSRDDVASFKRWKRLV